MARFSNKIESLRYADREHKSIEILYKNGESINSYYIEVDYNNQDFLDLLEEYSVEDIEDQTIAYYEKLNANKNEIIISEAKKMFDEWIKNAQKDLDKQDKERYDIFEKYKESIQEELDEQVKRRIEEGFHDVDIYREKQLSILQGELNAQVEQRYHEADEYKKEQLSVLQSELDEQIEQRYKELDTYAESEVKKQKEEFLAKFNMPTPTRYTPERVADYMLDNMNDEDMIFKTKLAIFNLPEVKNNQDREIKMKVRKAKSIPELFAVYNDIQHNHS